MLIHLSRSSEIQMALGKADNLTSAKPDWALRDLLAVIPFRPTMGSLLSYLQGRLHAKSFAFGYVERLLFCPVLNGWLHFASCSVLNGCLHFASCSVLNG